MARSADRVIVAALICVSVAGCVSTQTKAARVQLNDARIRAGEQPTRVRRAGSAASVQAVSLIRSARSSAIVVAVRNPGPRAVTDLPISVGVRAGRRVLRYLNARSASLDGYFLSHLPAIAPGQTVTWVYTTTRRLPRRARPFALVGSRPSAIGTAAVASGAIPVIRVRTAASAVAQRLPVTVRNLSSVPQYQLQVYLVARRGGRIVAAGGETVPFLAGDTGTRLSLRLIGRPGATPVEAQALPTTLQ